MPKRANFNDFVSVLKKDKTEISGTLLQSQNKDDLTLKLISGYNLILPKKEVSQIKLLKQIKEKTEIKSEIKLNKNLPLIYLVHTGGTLASRVDYKTGGVISQFSPEDIISIYPELKNIASLKSKLLRNMWSEDLRFKHFSLIAEDISKNCPKNASGVIVSMGTDNLAVAASALSFIFESLPFPVILVGSQRSSDRGSSDAALNLLSAALFITKSDFTGVAICMHSSMNDDYCNIFPATKTRKLHTSRRDAFKPVNDTIIAKVNYKTQHIEFIKHDYHKRDKNKKLIIKPKMEEKVALLKLHVNMFAKQFKVFKGYKGLILEGTGLGQSPLDVIDNITKPHKEIRNAIKSLVKSGTSIVMTSQCIFGSVNLNVYSKGRDLQELGVIPGKDMLAETALVKLSWLLANHPKKDIAKLISTNLHGEINPRLLAEEEFI